MGPARCHVRGRRAGEAVGIIGRNGAGKSTLLKSSRGSQADRKAAHRGRVGALLEVGTGFHPELDRARERLPERRHPGHEQDGGRAKFDEIVAFAEVERFLDTPVKRYSSGMHMRLAFAVAAHLEPEILIVDEVLAVGESRSSGISWAVWTMVTKGRTVLFVSHNLVAVQHFCQRCLLLWGKKIADGPPGDVISHVRPKRARRVAHAPCGCRGPRRDRSAPLPGGVPRRQMVRRSMDRQPASPSTLCSGTKQLIAGRCVTLSISGSGSRPRSVR